MESVEGPSVVWLRDDLRLSDNPALRAAIDRGAGIVVLYLLDEESAGIRPLGSATKWWLHHSLVSLGEHLESLGGTFVLRRGAAGNEVPKLVKEVGAGAVFWNRRYGGPQRDVDAALKSSLRDGGLDAQSFQGSLMHEPWTVTTGGGTPFKVFTPFWKACLEQGEPREPLPSPRTLDGVAGIRSDAIDDWKLLPTAPDWSAGIASEWTPGEAGAHQRLEDFIDDGLEDYAEGRDIPAKNSTSRLSPHLRFGEISPFQIWHRVQHGQLSAAAKRNAPKFLREVGWREFNWNILFHSPELPTKNFRPEFDVFPWSKPSASALKAWQTGMTGIPLVDAGMRELWQTGYMHNRVRMVVASLLIKNLLVDWRIGEEWFWDCLVDADEANNPANWQWVAGSGADAAPYFRVFNPELQAEKFDKSREYRRRYIPELDTDAYPAPIVDLRASRAEALEAYEQVRKAGVPRQ
jgi:deoxyribodipyrimidine photo-lyase